MCGSIGSCCIKPTSTLKKTCAFRAVVFTYMFLFLVVVVGNLCGGAIILSLDGELGGFQPAEWPATTSTFSSSSSSSSRKSRGVSCWS